jgi:hypothetical protein
MHHFHAKKASRTANVTEKKVSRGGPLSRPTTKHASGHRAHSSSFRFSRVAFLLFVLLSLPFTIPRVVSFVARRNVHVAGFCCCLVFFLDDFALPVLHLAEFNFFANSFLSGASLFTDFGHICTDLRLLRMRVFGIYAFSVVERRARWTGRLRSL